LIPGIGGFNARLRGNRYREENEEPLEAQSGGATAAAAAAAAAAVAAAAAAADAADSAANGAANGPLPLPPADDKPKRKPMRRKPKAKLAENFPSYLQVRHAVCEKIVSFLSFSAERSVKHVTYLGHPNMTVVKPHAAYSSSHCR